MIRFLQAVYYAFKPEPPKPKRWFGFRSGDETRFGYGTDDDANDYCDRLNRGRKTNLYSTIRTKETVGAVDLSEELRKGA